MSDKSELIRESPDQIFSVVYLIKIMSDIFGFEKWLKGEKSKEFDSSIFPGYKFMLETLLRLFMQFIIYDDSLKLKSDYLIYRANHEGISIEDIPNNSEITIFIKKINFYLEQIENSKNKENLGQVIKKLKLEIIDKFQKIFEEETIVKKGIRIDKEKVLKNISIYWAFIHLLDNRNHHPMGYFVSVLNNEISYKKLSESFEGYRYSLQYLFFKLLGDLKDYKLKNLDNPYKIFKKEELLEEYGSLFGGESNNTKNQGTIMQWYSIDKFFRITNREVIEKLEKEMGELGFSRFLFFKKDFNFSKIKKIIQFKPKDPEYLSKRGKGWLEKRLDLLFMWYYHFDILDDQRQLIFNGVPAFISVLSGHITIKNERAGGEPVKVIRFVHPEKRVNGNNYSYAIFIEAYGGIGDYSGWIIFYDCCGDYSGFSGSEHYLAESYIKRYKKEGLLEVEEFKISLEDFNNYLSNRIVFDNRKKTRLKLESSKLNIMYRNKFNNLKGMFLELLGFYVYSQIPPEKIDWAVSTKKDLGDIDLIIKKENKIYFVEVKFPVPLTDKLDKKIEFLCSKQEFQKEWEINDNTEKIKVYCFWEEKDVDKSKFDKKDELWFMKNELSKNPRLREQIGRINYLVGKGNSKI